MVRKGVLSFGLWVAVAGLAGAQGLPAGAPEQSGMAADRLARITGAMQGLVDQGRVAGTVTLVARNGKVVYHEAAGRRDVEKNVPMTTDTLFRIASMSKAVTSVAVMMLVEEGKVHLDDPVSCRPPQEPSRRAMPARRRPRGRSPSATC
jgi:CubicO group peptidase (beta-lactamase class C family)